jgi:hypothetical protein
VVFVLDVGPRRSIRALIRRLRPRHPHGGAAQHRSVPPPVDLKNYARVRQHCFGSAGATVRRAPSASPPPFTALIRRTLPRAERAVPGRLPPSRSEVKKTSAFHAVLVRSFLDWLRSMSFSVRSAPLFSDKTSVSILPRVFLSSWCQSCALSASY